MYFNVFILTLRLNEKVDTPPFEKREEPQPINIF